MIYVTFLEDLDHSFYWEFTDLKGKKKRYKTFGRADNAVAKILAPGQKICFRLSENPSNALKAEFKSIIEPPEIPLYGQIH